jgi:dephospho-CoA kinase
MVIGLTGQIGSGKTTVAGFLGEMGAVVIDADQIGRQVVEQSLALLGQLRAEFGETIVDEAGGLRREHLAELAFATEERKARLNALVHPHLLKELRRQVKQAVGEVELVVVDAALLLEWNLDSEMDQTWVIHASEKTRLERLKARGMSRPDAVARQKGQASESVFRERADHVIENNGTLDELKAAVRRLRDLS